MSSIATKYGALTEAFAVRLGRPMVAGADSRPEREPQRRALELAVGGPLLVCAFAWMVLPAFAGIAATIVFTCISFGAAVAGALLLSVSGRASLAVRVTLGVLAAQLCVLLAACGGLQSPAAALLLALPVEARLADQKRPLTAWALALLMASALLSMAIAGASSGVAVPSAWQWLFSAVYAATVLARQAMRRTDAETSPHEAASSQAEADFDLFILRFAANGDLLSCPGDSTGVLGVGEDLLMGTGLFERIHVADRVAFLCGLADLRDGAPRRRLELRIRVVGEAADLGHRPFVLDLRRTGECDDVFAGLLSDNTEVEDLRAALTAAKEAANGLEVAKGQFLASVSHELRTPLNSIIGFSDMLMCEVYGSLANERQKENVGIIREAGLHLLGVVNSILDVSRIEAGSYAINPEPFRFNDAAALCCQMMRVQAENKAISLKLSIPAVLGELNADRRAVQQMLINLISNAVKFTPAGGTIAIGASKVGSRLHFWVSDSGIGISKDDLDRIGQPFAQVQNDYTRQYDGVGLGLVLVKGLVVLHEGTLSIDSALGSGTTVTITLPVDGPRAEAEPARAKWVNAEARTHGTFRKAG